MKGKRSDTGRAAPSKREYLYQLGRYLLFYFPEDQALDILGDYQEYFSREGLPPEESIRRWGTPEQALSSLLGENPGARGYGYRHGAFWGAFLLLALLCGAFLENGLLFSLLLLPLGLLGLSRAPACRRLEQRLAPPPPAGKRGYLAHGLAAAAVVVLEAGAQGLLRQGPAFPAEIGGIPAGRLLSAGCLLLAVSMGLLLFWMLWRALSHSIRYLAGACHALGALAFMLGLRSMLFQLASPASAGRALFGVLLYYGIGLLLALLLWGWMRPKRRE